MMMKQFFILISATAIIISSAPASFAGYPVGSPEYHIEQGNNLLRQNQPFAAVEEYRLAIRKGAMNPVLFRNLSIVLYDLGLLEEAAAEMKRALSLAPYESSFQRELGVIYLAEGRHDEARKQFLAILERNPGYTNAYYYLGEVYFRAGDFDMAWTFAKMARLLGHRGNGLVTRLKDVSEPADVEPWQDAGHALFIRQILVDTKEHADEIIGKIKNGALFEDIADETDRIPGSAGGFLGNFTREELDPRIARVLEKSAPFSAPVVVRTNLGYHVVQRIVPFDFIEWQKLVAESGQSDRRKLAKKGNGKNRDIIPVNAVQSTPSPVSYTSQSRELTNVSAPKQVEMISHSNISPENHGNEPRKLYYVYAGVFRSKEYAVERVNKLHEIGLPAYSYIKNSETGPLTVVVAGSYAARDEAMSTARSIKSLGFDYYIARRDSQ